MSINGKAFDFSYTLPTAFASVLINDDWTGCSEEDEEIITNVLANEFSNAHCVDVSEETFFCKYHDAKPYGWLADTCSEFFFIETEAS